MAKFELSVEEIFIEFQRSGEILRDHGNPTESLGVDQSFNSESFISFAEKCRLEGASILGGCCEVLPSHIKALAEFYKN